MPIVFTSLPRQSAGWWSRGNVDPTSPHSKTSLDLSSLAHTGGRRGRAMRQNTHRGVRWLFHYNLYNYYLYEALDLMQVANESILTSPISQL
jgi:hypothetical protein